MHIAKTIKWDSFSKLLILMVLVSCSNRTDWTHLTIDPNKPSRKGIELRDYCDRIEILPLSGVNEIMSGSKLCVYDNGFILQKNHNSLVIYGNDGSLKKELVSDGIGDFSVYEGQTLYILSSDKIVIFDLNCLSPKGCLELSDTTLTYLKVAGRDDDAVSISALKDSACYQCEYYLQEGKFFRIKYTRDKDDGPFKNRFEQGTFFYAEGVLHFSDSETGIVWRQKTFSNPDFQWDIQEKKGHNVVVENVQMSGNRVFMRIKTDGSDYCYIADKNDPQHSKLYSSSITPSFQLGEIYQNVNYYYCKSKDIDKYVRRDILMSERDIEIDSLKSSSGNVIIKYHLK